MIEKFRELINNIKDSFDDLATQALLTYNITEEEYNQGLSDGSLRNGAYQFPSVNYISEDFNGPTGYPIMPYTGYVERDGVIWVGCGYTNTYTSVTPSTRYIYRISEDVLSNRSIIDKIPIRPDDNQGNIQACAGNLQTRVGMDANNYIYMLNLSTNTTQLSLTVIDPDENITKLDLPPVTTPSLYYFLGNTSSFNPYRSFEVPFSEYHTNITDDGGIWVSSYRGNQYYVKNGVLERTVNMTPTNTTNPTMTYQTLHTVVGNRLYIVNTDGFIAWCDIDGTSGTIDIRSYYNATSLYYSTSKRLFSSPSNNSLYLFTQVNTTPTVQGWKGIIKINLNDESTSFIPAYTASFSTAFTLSPGIINNDDYLIWNSTYDRTGNTIGASSTGYITILNKNTDNISLVDFVQGYTTNFNNYLYKTEDNRILAVLKSKSTGFSAQFMYSLYELNPINNTLNELYQDISLYYTMPSISDINNEIYIGSRTYANNKYDGSLIYSKNGTFYKCDMPPIPAIYPMVNKYKDQFLVMDSYGLSLPYSPVTENSYYVLNEDNTITNRKIDENLVLGSWFYHRNSFSLPKGILTGCSYAKGSMYEFGDQIRNKVLDDVPTTAGTIVVNGRELVRKQ